MSKDESAGGANWRLFNILTGSERVIKLGIRVVCGGTKGCVRRMQSYSDGVDGLAIIMPLSVYTVYIYIYSEPRVILLLSGK